MFIENALGRLAAERSDEYKVFNEYYRLKPSMQADALTKIRLANYYEDEFEAILSEEERDFHVSLGGE